jgi:hypothetical protein
MRLKDLGLYRTMKLNYVPYFTDGNGRDRYIAFDNGGFFTNKESNKENTRRTGTSFDTKVTYKYVSPYMKTPNFHYHSDGNGRDSYIFTNGGGLFYDSKPLNSYKLTDFLRANETGFSRNGKVWVSKSQDKYNKLLRAKEKDIIFRLYENEKRKFIKKKKAEELNDFMEDNNEEPYKTIQTEIEVTKLPKLNDKKNNINYDASNTLNNDLDNPIEDNEKEPSKTIDVNKKSNRKFIFPKNIHEHEGMLLNSLSKINNFDVSKKLKKSNKSFNQAYFHLRNVNYDQKYE